MRFAEVDARGAVVRVIDIPDVEDGLHYIMLEMGMDGIWVEDADGVASPGTEWNGTSFLFPEPGETGSALFL